MQRHPKGRMGFTLIELLAETHITPLRRTRGGVFVCIRR